MLREFFVDLLRAKSLADDILSIHPTIEVDKFALLAAKWKNCVIAINF